MRKLARSLAFLALGVVALAGPARAEIGTNDAVPAATLLLPYFEVDLDDPNGVNTIINVNNASASAALAHVTLWTDEAIPTFNFDVYLTGFDVQRISLRSVFEGNLPVTADDGNDPADTGSPNDGISNQGTESQDINFPGTTGPCGLGTVYSNPELTDMERRHLRRSHTGLKSQILNGCVGARYGDRIARGYVTVDSITECSIDNPSAPGYFTGIADSRNLLWGDFEMVHPAQNSRDSGTLVHIEACIPGNGYLGYVGSGAGFCPFGAGEYTFYGRLVAFAGTDQREPLPTTFAARYANGGMFNGGTDVLVWRDTKEPLTGPNAKHGCVLGTPTWFPLGQSDVVAFDEQEDPTDLCAAGNCFPLAAQRAATASGTPLGDPMVPPAPFGWLYLNLNHGGGAALTGVAQAWVTSSQSALGRFSVGLPAIALDNAATAASGGHVILP